MSLFSKLFSPIEPNAPKEAVEQDAVSLHSEATYCPYCSVVLIKIPTRKSKCPHCHKDIYVRNKQTLFPHQILTEHQADAVDLIKNFEFLGLNDESFKREQELLSAKFGKPADIPDTIWSIYNGLLDTLSRTNDFSQMAIIYFQMASHLVNEGKDGQRFVVEANKMTLRDYSRMNAIDFEIESSINCCEACEKQGGSIHKLTSELLTKPPLPPYGCTCVFTIGKPPMCTCLYIAKSFK